MTQHSGSRRLGEALGSIAVLRALQLGDLLCAVPAWRALRAAYPTARIALIGLPWAREFATRFHRYFDEFIEFPGYPGLPERTLMIDRIPDFFKTMQARRFDCALQMQGSGRYTNDIVALCGARIMAGYCAAPDPCPNPHTFMAYPDGMPEVRRHLAFMSFLGIPSLGEDLEFPITEQDEAAFQRIDDLAGLQPGSYVCLHPGGRRQTNRWEPEHFARVADRLAAEGLRIVLTGTEPELDVGKAVTQAMRSRPLNVIGHTTLGSLAVLLSRARLLVSNDTGLSHLAAALAVPSVVVTVGSDPVRWGPLNRVRHRVLSGSEISVERALNEARQLLHPNASPEAAMELPDARAVLSSRGTAARREGRRPLRVLTWHIHGNYLYYLSHTPHEFLLPVERSGPGYAGCAPGFPWPSNVRDVPVDELPRTEFDCILFQSEGQYLVDQYELLTAEQRALPKIYLEHDPPQEHPTDTIHPVDDPDMLLVHVTQFNRLMWDSRRTPTRVIEHGVVVPDHLSYSGDLEKGLVVVNHLHRRGRRLGADLFDYVRTRVPLDLAGMDSLGVGGLGDIGHDELPELMCRYRFVFHPIRYTSLGLALCEAMSLGVPPVVLATTEAPRVIEHNVSGYLDTDVEALIRWMKHLLSYPDEARRIGAGAKAAARARFDITRFARDWDATLTEFVGTRRNKPGRASAWDVAHTEALS